ncbi:MAG: hypothetical protein ABEK59_03130 [Halobacteria archaeon]
MKHQDVKQLLNQAHEYPIDHDSVMESLGEVEVEAPGGGKMNLKEILEHTSQDKYHTVDDIYHTLMANLDENFIGRKHYCDRAGIRKGFDKEKIPTDISWL